MMASLLSDLRYAWRSLRTHRAFSTAVIATVALIVGVNAGVFSVVDHVVLRPLSFPEARRVVALCEYPEREREGFCITSPPNAADIATTGRAFSAIGIGRDWPFVVRTKEGATSVSGGLASPSLFTVFGVRAERGRLFAPDEIGPAAKVVVVTHRFWMERLGGDPGVVNRTINLDDGAYVVVGVLAEGTKIPTMDGIDLWSPLPFLMNDEENRTWRGFRAFARLAPASTIEAARQEMAVVGGSIRSTHFSDKPDWRIELKPAQDLVVGSARRTLFTFFGAVGFVLLIGCANLATLYLARSAQRSGEFALRAALGASRRRLVRSVLVETLLTSIVGGVLGIVVATWFSRAFVAMAPGDIPRLDEVHVDVRVAVFALAVAAVTGLLFGLGPAIRSGRLDVRSQIGSGARTSSMRSVPLGRTLVAAEIALAVVLVTGSGLLIRSLANLGRWSPGIPLERVTSTWLLASQAKYASRAQVASLFARVEDAVRQVPGVAAVGSASAGPLFGGTETSDAVAVDDATGGAPRHLRVRWFDASPGYFASLGLPIVRGRGLAATDVEGAPLVAVVNEQLARQMWPDADPIGRQIRVPDDSITLTVVGVVKNVTPMNPSAAVEPELTWSNRQRARWATFITIRTSVSPGGLVRAVQARLREVDPDMQVSAFRTLAERASREHIRPRFNAMLMAGFSLLALALSVVGVYGVQSFAVAQRTREFGVRLALGATPSTIMREVLRTGMRTAVIALVVGAAASLVVSRALVPLLAGVSPSDALSLGAAIILLVIVTTLASAAPARRASRVDPMRSLRQD